MTRESALDIIVEDPVLVTLPYWQQMAAVGVPPHITLLYPWRSAPVDSASIEVLRTVLQQFEAFSLTLSHVATFLTGVVYAGAEPNVTLRSLIAAIAEAFPDTPPYGGQFATEGPVAHLTLARCERDELEGTRSDYASALSYILPIRIRVTAICVEEQTNITTWATTRVIPLGRDLK